MNVSSELELGSKTEGRGAALAANSARLVTLNPLQHPGWDTLLAAHPESSVFHTTAWARVLGETYRHTPVYVCRFVNGHLEGLLPVMEVSSRLTGRRGVSLPFTDFCGPLAGIGCDPGELYALAMQAGRNSRWRYLECRGDGAAWKGASPSLVFRAHVLDLECGQEALFKAFDGATRRGIRKAEEAQLQVEFGHAPAAMRTFYALHCRTRRRHGLPPQPLRFFANIGRRILEQGHGFVVTARLGQSPVAVALFFHHGRQVLFKFGASDYTFQHLRPNNLVMWRAIQWYANHGFARLHLGRTSLANEGLRRFKRGFGAREEEIRYYRYDFGRERFVTDRDRTEGVHNRLFRYLPLALLRLAGALLYPHLS